MVTIQLDDQLSEMHEIASAIAMTFPLFCGRLHLLADQIEHKMNAPAISDKLITPATSHRNGHRKPGPKGKARARGAKVHGTGLASTMTTCPICNKPVKARGLGIHMALKHKSIGASAAGD